MTARFGDEQQQEEQQTLITMSRQYCSYAAMGRIETFQAIYVCHSCNAKSRASDGSGGGAFCVCAACAESCHHCNEDEEEDKDVSGNEHDVEYVGMGPCYCDCLTMGCCTISQDSIDEAHRLGICDATGISAVVAAAATAAPTTSAEPLPVATERATTIAMSSAATARTDVDYIRDVYELASLKHDVSLAANLARQAQELVQHSRDTFWLDEATVQGAADETSAESEGGSSLCDLERLAWTIYRRHVQHYASAFNAPNSSTTSTNDGYSIVQGAEWWVQVKPVTTASSALSEAEATSLSINDEEGAVDLHYDKDEALAESFGLGIFPTLSTVTYLTDSTHAAPTLVFARRYDQGNDYVVRSSTDDDESNDNMDDINESAKISDMMLCRPRRGKHLVFDGRLLHGAPSHWTLRPPHDNGSATNQAVNGSSSKSSNKVTNHDHVPDAACAITPETAWRITFLVNLWLSHKPAGVHVLPDSIRKAIQATSPLLQSSSETVIFDTDQFAKLCVTELHLTSQSDLPERACRRIELPFVGGKSTWSNAEEDEEEDCIVVMTYAPPSPPPPTCNENDTLLLRFGLGMEAYMAVFGGGGDWPDEVDDDNAWQLKNTSCYYRITVHP